MRRFALVIGFVLLTPTIYAWGPRGHQISAIVAERNLNEAAAAQVNDLLNGESLADVANFADAIRDSRPDTKDWHFVDIEITDDAFDDARDCSPHGHPHTCVVDKIEQFKAVLRDQAKPRAERVEALKFLIHFIPDMHQPLHAADNHDGGGNGTMVKFFGTNGPLHKTWDSGLIGRAGINDDEKYADHLETLFEEAEIPDLTAGTTISWANESHRLAKPNAYRIPPSKNLGNAYLQRNLPIVDDQLLRGGLRLARVLNEILH
jgi:hypothetical protein